MRHVFGCPATGCASSVARRASGTRPAPRPRVRRFAREVDPRIQMLQQAAREDHDTLMCGACSLPPFPGTRPGLTVSNTHNAVRIGLEPAEAAKVSASPCSIDAAPCASACHSSIIESPGVGAPSPSTTRNASRMRSPSAPSRARIAQLRIGGQREIEERPHRLRRARNQAHFAPSSNGVARRPRSTMSNR